MILVFLILISVIDLLLALFILFNAPKKLNTKLFAGFLGFALLWAVGDALMLFGRSDGLVQIGSLLFAIAPLFVMLGVYWFAMYFPDDKTIKIPSLANIIISAIPILVSVWIILYQDTIFTIDINIYADSLFARNTMTAEANYVLYSYYFSLYFLLYASLLIRKYLLFSKVDPKSKGKIKYFLISISTSTLFAFIPNLVLPAYFGNTNYIWLGPLSAALFALLITYSIVKYELFEVRLIVIRTLAYVLSLFFVAVMLVVTLYMLTGFITGKGVNITTTQGWSYIVVTLIAALIYGPIQRFFDKFSNRIFYRDAYDGQEFLNNINSKIVTSNDLHLLLIETANEIKNTVKVEHANFYIDSAAAIEFHTAGTNTSIFASAEWGELLNEINKVDQKVITPESIESLDGISTLFHKLGIELLFKMISKDKNVGYLILSERKSGNSFSQQDIQVLEIIADELAISVQNTVQLEQISQFTVTLQKKIDEATGELQKTNEKLRSLDEAKDEFISMASHQLRTPLTSVKGYISMLREGDAGDINDTQKKFLDQAFTSSQRMVYLIADLLNVSRLKTGKFVIEPSPTYLPDVVESEIEQLNETANARGLELIFNKPETFPTLNLDETKIRQVIMNFVDNAIYYTPRDGRITVALKQLKNSIEYTVTDTGIGVPKKEQHHLFTKFYRAGNAKKARPDGTGLGLYMAKKVVVAQGGSIIFKTSEGKGSTFGFSFPLPKEEV